MKKSVDVAQHLSIDGEHTNSMKFDGVYIMDVSNTENVDLVDVAVLFRDRNHELRDYTLRQLVYNIRQIQEDPLLDRTRYELRI